MIYTVKVRNNKNHSDGYIRFDADTRAAAMAGTMIALMELGFTGLSVLDAVPEKDIQRPA